jgi:hypothetical protein
VIRISLAGREAKKQRVGKKRQENCGERDKNRFIRKMRTHHVWINVSYNGIRS